MSEISIRCKKEHTIDKNYTRKETILDYYNCLKCDKTSKDIHDFKYRFATQKWVDSYDPDDGGYYKYDTLLFCDYQCFFNYLLDDDFRHEFDFNTELKKKREKLEKEISHLEKRIKELFGSNDK